METSYINRLRQIKKLNNRIPEVRVEDTASLREIQNIIESLDLTDARLGAVLDKATVDEFYAKLKENERYQSRGQEETVELEQ